MQIADRSAVIDMADPQALRALLEAERARFLAAAGDVFGHEFAGEVVALGRGAEGLSTGETLHPVQQAFVDCQAAQCGYCLNGMLMATVALLQQHPQPTDAQARTALQHHLCRCGTHIEILAAVQRAAVLLNESTAKRGGST